MKPFFSAMALLLVSSVKAQDYTVDKPPQNSKKHFLDGNEAAYDILAPCGKCIASGFNFCWKS
jgi:hypothetical protein